MFDSAYERHNIINHKTDPNYSLAENKEILKNQFAHNNPGFLYAHNNPGYLNHDLLTGKFSELEGAQNLHYLATIQEYMLSRHTQKYPNSDLLNKKREELSPDFCQNCDGYYQDYHYNKWNSKYMRSSDVSFETGFAKNLGISGFNFRKGTYYIRTKPMPTQEEITTMHNAWQKAEGKTDHGPIAVTVEHMPISELERASVTPAQQTESKGQANPTSTAYYQAEAAMGSTEEPTTFLKKIFLTHIKKFLQEQSQKPPINSQNTIETTSTAAANLENSSPNSKVDSVSDPLKLSTKKEENVHLPK